MKKKFQSNLRVNLQYDIYSTFDIEEKILHVWLVDNIILQEVIKSVFLERLLRIQSIFNSEFLISHTYHIK